MSPGTTRAAIDSHPDPAGINPREGFHPTRPQASAGIRMDPPPSEPGAKGTKPAATAAAAPPLEPPADRVRSWGLRVSPVARDSVDADIPNSDVAVLPTLMAPTWSSHSAIGSEAVATGRPFDVRDPYPVGIPARATRSLSALGIPVKGGVPCAEILCCARSACS